MCAASRLSARRRTAIVVSCELRWTFWCWKTACWIRKSNRSLPKMRIGGVSLGWIDQATPLWVLLEFIGEAFEDATLSDDENNLLSRIRERLSEFDAFSKTRLAEIFPASEANQEEWDRLIECPCCLKPTLRCDAAVTCMFCGYRETSEDAAEFFIAQRVDAGPRFSCPECDNNTLV